MLFFCLSGLLIWQTGDDAFDQSDEEVLSLNLPRRDTPSEDEDEAEAPLTVPKRKNKSDHAPRTVGDNEMSRFKRPDPVSEDEGSGSEEESSEAEEGWGAAYHVSRKEREQGSPVADTRAEQLEIEQEELDEALRIQRLAKEKLTKEDYGDFDAIAIEQRTLLEEEEVALQSNGITEIHFDKPVSAPQEVVQPQMTREEAIVHLVATQPHLLSLLHDFADCAANLPEAEQRHKTLVAVHSKAKEPLHPAIGLSKLHLDLLKAYLAVSAFWLKLVAEAGSSELSETVLKRLVGLREGLQSLEEQGIGMEDSDDEGEDGPVSMLELLNEKNMDREELLEFLRSQEEEGEEEEELDEEDVSTEDMSAFGEESEEEVEPEPVSKKRKATVAPAVEKKKRKTEKEDSNRPSFLQPDYESASRPKKTKASLAQDDFIEAPSLTSHEANDRANNKHTLRFHTSQINQKANRRSAARGALAGGDEDVPQRSKEAMRREAQRRESAKRAKELEADAASAKKVAESQPEEDDDGYYGLIKKGKKAEKEAQKEEYDQGRLEDRYVSVLPLDALADFSHSAALQTLQSADGPRSISRAILANKGLTPKRAKANRNPRVKKRLKYEKAKKKVGSMKSIYKADAASAGRSGYGGEKSGIGKKVVKSRKL